VRRFLESHLPTVLWSALVAVLLLSPGDLDTPAPAWLEWFEDHGGDKLVHAGLFFVQAACLGRTLRGWSSDRHAGAWWAALASFLYGTALEVAQLAIGSRSFEVADVAADAAGAVLWPLAAWLHRRRAR
jgi:VanZ family protein